MRVAWWFNHIVTALGLWQQGVAVPLGHGVCVRSWWAVWVLMLLGHSWMKEARCWSHSEGWSMQAGAWVLRGTEMGL